MSNIDFWEKVLQNVKDNAVFIVIMLIVLMLPWILYGGADVLGFDIPFWTVVNAFIWSVKEGTEANIAVHNMPGIVQTVIKLIMYIIGIIFSLWAGFMIWKKVIPSADNSMSMGGRSTGSMWWGTSRDMSSWSNSSSNSARKPSFW